MAELSKVRPMSRLRCDLCPDSSQNGARGTRTPDLLGAIQALSQLSYSPVRSAYAARSADSLAPGPWPGVRGWAVGFRLECAHPPIHALRSSRFWPIGSGRDGPAMSFRTRLTSFFLLIVVVPMVAVGFLVFRLINDSANGKADARANGLATAAVSLYRDHSATARTDAEAIAKDPALLSGSALQPRLATFATRAGLARVTLKRGARVIADVGDRTAVAPGIATVRTPGGGASLSVTGSIITAAEYAKELAGSRAAVVVRQGSSTLGSTLRITPRASFPRHGTVTVAGVGYRAMTEVLAGFGHPIEVTVLSNLSATATSVGSSRLVAAIFIIAFLLLAFSFSALASHALQRQLNRFLEAAKRLGGGDFSSPIPTEGRDEFAALGAEFNSMSTQLAKRLDELSQERARLRDSIARIGHTFASNLDRPELLKLALQTAIDAVKADSGRLSARAESSEPLAEAVLVGSLVGHEDQVFESERSALAAGGLGEAASDGINAASVSLEPIESDGRTHGLITVCREGLPFTDDDRDVLRSLATQATLALENVELHFQVRRQAVTDELTQLANHGRFQDLLGAEIERVRRYHHPVGLIMLDLDDFKSVNDTYGHQQGDVVLRHVARVLSDFSREADVPARYGGEEMALILPHTDLDGSHAIAERVRTSIEALRVPRLDQQGVLRITASLGVAAATDGHKDALIADADGALYAAKRQGKNRTVQAQPQSANVFSAE
jgi:diguanylate cyclase (GGDEF)-like protein